MAQGTPGSGLSKWSDAMREMYLDLRAKNFVSSRAQTLVLEAYQAESDEPLHAYSHRSLSDYEKSAAGSERLTALEGDFREGAVKRSFSHKGSRVGSLVEVAIVLLERFRKEDEKGDDARVGSLTALSREIREQLQAIQREVDPLGLSPATVQSFYAEQAAMFASLSSRGKEMLKIEKEPDWLKLPATPQ